MNELQTFIQTSTWLFPTLICLAVIFTDLALYSYYGHLLQILTITGLIAGVYSLVYVLLLQSLGVPLWTVMVSAPLFAIYFGVDICYIALTNKRISDWEK
jgi:hypothetical protein